MDREETKREGVEEFCMIMWNIWVAKNKTVFENIEPKAVDIFERAMS